MKDLSVGIVGGGAGLGALLARMAVAEGAMAGFRAPGEIIALVHKN